MNHFLGLPSEAYLNHLHLLRVCKLPLLEGSFCLIPDHSHRDVNRIPWLGFQLTPQGRFLFGQCLKRVCPKAGIGHPGPPRSTDPLETGCRKSQTDRVTPAVCSTCL